MANTAIPLVLCGKIDTHLQACVEAAKPNFNRLVIETFKSVEEIQEKLPGLLSSKSIQGVIMGGGFKPEDFDTVYEIAGAKEVLWLRPESMKPGGTGPPPPGKVPPPEFVSQRLRKALDSYQEPIKQGKGPGEVWYF